MKAIACIQSTMFLPGADRLTRSGRFAIVFIRTCYTRDTGWTSTSMSRQATLSKSYSGRPPVRNAISSLLVWRVMRSEEHTSELQSLMRISYAVFCLKKKTNKQTITQLSFRHHSINEKWYYHQYRIGSTALTMVYTIIYGL